MSFVILTAEETNDAVLVSYKLSTEDRLVEGSETEYEYRAVLSVIISQEARNVSEVSQPTNQIYSKDSLTVRFNQLATAEILPLTNLQGDTTYNFRLVDQDYHSYSAKGSTFYQGVKEYVSVSEWEELFWI